MVSGQMAMDLGRRGRPGERAVTGGTYSRLVWRRFRRPRLAVVGGGGGGVPFFLGGVGEGAVTGETSSRLVWRRFRRHRLAVIGGSAAVFLSLVAVLAMAPEAAPD